MGPRSTAALVFPPKVIGPCKDTQGADVAEAVGCEPRYTEMQVQAFIEFLKAEFPHNLEHLPLPVLLGAWEEFKRRIFRPLA